MARRTSHSRRERPLRTERTWIRLRGFRLGGILLAVSATLPRTGARAAPAEAPGLAILSAEEAEKTPAARYADLTDEEAVARLEARHIAFERVASAPGVRTPIRLAGPLHGVDIHSALPPEERRTSVFEILDARLALALDDFAEVLSHHDVVEVVHFTMYRPTDRDPEESSHGRARHPGGMAIDVGALRKRTGTKLTVGVDWPPEIGARTCGRTARKLPDRRGRELQSIACEAADLRLFHSILTPHFNRAHHDHLHLEIRPGTRWFLVH